MWSILTVSDEEGLHHVNQEMEAKTAALFGLDRFEIYEHVHDFFCLRAELLH